MHTFIGGLGGPVLITIVEWVSCYTLIALAGTKEAIAVGVAILDAMHPHCSKVLTMTYDGKEFARHVLLEANAYFAHPYNS